MMISLVGAKKPPSDSTSKPAKTGSTNLDVLSGEDKAVPETSSVETVSETDLGSDDEASVKTVSSPERDSAAVQTYFLTQELTDSGGDDGDSDNELFTIKSGSILAASGNNSATKRLAFSAKGRLDISPGSSSNNSRREHITAPHHQKVNRQETEVSLIDDSDDDCSLPTLEGPKRRRSFSAVKSTVSKSAVLTDKKHHEMQDKRSVNGGMQVKSSNFHESSSSEADFESAYSDTVSYASTDKQLQSAHLTSHGASGKSHSACDHSMTETSVSQEAGHKSCNANSDVFADGEMPECSEMSQSMFEQDHVSIPQKGGPADSEHPPRNSLQVDSPQGVSVRKPEKIQARTRSRESRSSSDTIDPDEEPAPPAEQGASAAKPAKIQARSRSKDSRTSSDTVDPDEEPAAPVFHWSSLDSDATQPYLSDDDLPSLTSISTIPSIIKKQESGQSLPPPSLTKMLSSLLGKGTNNAGSPASGNLLAESCMKHKSQTLLGAGANETEKHGVSVSHSSTESTVGKEPEEDSQDSVNSDASQPLFDEVPLDTDNVTDGVNMERTSNTVQDVEADAESPVSDHKDEAGGSSARSAQMSDHGDEVADPLTSAGLEQDVRSCYTLEDDMVMVFDSEEEEMFSSFTQVQVKQEKVSDDEDGMDSDDAEDDLRDDAVDIKDDRDDLDDEDVKMESAEDDDLILASAEADNSKGSHNFKSSSVYDMPTQVDDNSCLTGDDIDEDPQKTARNHFSSSDKFTSVYDNPTLVDDDISSDNVTSVYDNPTLVDDDHDDSFVYNAPTLDDDDPSKLTGFGYDEDPYLLDTLIDDNVSWDNDVDKTTEKKTVVLKSEPSSADVITDGGTTGQTVPSVGDADEKHEKEGKDDLDDDMDDALYMAATQIDSPVGDEGVVPCTEFPSKPEKHQDQAEKQHPPEQEAGSSTPSKKRTARKSLQSQVKEVLAKIVVRTEWLKKPESTAAEELSTDTSSAGMTEIKKSKASDSDASAVIDLTLEDNNDTDVTILQENWASEDGAVSAQNAAGGTKPGTTVETSQQKHHPSYSRESDGLSVKSFPEIMKKKEAYEEDDIYCAETLVDEDPFLVMTQVDYVEPMEDSSDGYDERGDADAENKEEADDPELVEEKNKSERQDSADEDRNERNDKDRQEHSLSSDNLFRGKKLSLSRISSDDTEGDEDRTIETARQKMTAIAQRAHVPHTIQIEPRAENRRRGEHRGLHQKLCDPEPANDQTSEQQDGALSAQPVKKKKRMERRSREEQFGIQELSNDQVSKQEVPAPSTSANSNSDDGWLAKKPEVIKPKSKLSSKSLQPQKARRRQRGSSETLTSGIEEARRKMEERSIQAIVNPVATGSNWRKKSAHVEVPDADTDVELPSTQEVMDLGLPLMTKSSLVPKKRSHQGEAEDSGRGKHRRGEEGAITASTAERDKATTSSVKKSRDRRGTLKEGSSRKESRLGSTDSSSGRSSKPEHRHHASSGHSSKHCTKTGQQHSDLSHKHEGKEKNATGTYGKLSEVRERKRPEEGTKSFTKSWPDQQPKSNQGMQSYSKSSFGETRHGAVEKQINSSGMAHKHREMQKKEAATERSSGPFSGPRSGTFQHGDDPRKKPQPAYREHSASFEKERPIASGTSKPSPHHGNIARPSAILSTSQESSAGRGTAHVSWSRGVPPPAPITSRGHSDSACQLDVPRGPPPGWQRHTSQDSHRPGPSSDAAVLAQGRQRHASEELHRPGASEFQRPSTSHSAAVPVPARQRHASQESQRPGPHAPTNSGASGPGASALGRQGPPPQEGQPSRHRILMSTSRLNHKASGPKFVRFNLSEQPSRPAPPPLHASSSALLQKHPVPLQELQQLGGRGQPSGAVQHVGMVVEDPQLFLKEDALMNKLLKWQPPWLEEYERRVDGGSPNSLPPIVDKNSTYPLCTAYENVSDYQQICFTLMLMELWEEIFRSWKERKSRQQICHAVFADTTRCRNNNELIKFSFKGLLTCDQHRQNRYPQEGDIVIVDMLGMDLQTAAAGNGQKVPVEKRMQRFAYVTERVNVQPCRNLRELASWYPALEKHPAFNTPPEDQFVMNVTLKLCYRKFAPMTTELISLWSVGSVVSAMRRFHALQLLPHCALKRDILKPSKHVYHHQCFKTNQPVLQKGVNKFNETQSQVIKSVASSMLQPIHVPRICLLQGPPGTGKSHVIIGIILRILQESQNKARICLAAPSNAAVDELLRRLVKKRKEDSVHFSVVRIGNSLCVDLKDFLWERITEKEKQEEIMRRKLQKVPKSVLTEHNRLQTRIKDTKLKLEQHQKNDNLQMQEKCQQELEGLKKQLARFKRNIGQQDVTLTAADVAKISDKVFLDANIVCGTLNSFGSKRIENILRRNSGVKTEKKTPFASHFTCAIMDEATQATELDSLIPLQFGMTKLVLVGDPNQLPPTVLSMSAQSLNYGLSLYERLQNYLRDEAESDAVMKLDTQYRMDPSICHFPNEYIYSRLLKTDSLVIESCGKFWLQPYRLFDIEDSQEKMSQSGSLSNELEAECTAVLCEELLGMGLTLQKSSIGVICPYASQKRLVQKRLCERGLSTIEVNTVDGFQGREKHIIILTCVRARSSSGGIGFMADRRRMNVALTRAKYALYIIGHFQSLKSDRDWKALIQDAEHDRQVALKVPSLEGFPEIIRKYCVKPQFQHKIRQEGRNPR